MMPHVACRHAAHSSARHTPRISMQYAHNIAMRPMVRVSGMAGLRAAAAATATPRPHHHQSLLRSPQAHYHWTTRTLAAASADATAIHVEGVSPPSSSAGVSGPTSTSTTPAPPSPSSSSSAALELDFDDVSTSFSVKSELEIWRALFVFKLCSFKPLVLHSRRLLDLSSRWLGRPLTHWALRQSFFGHFCAGETDEEVIRTVAKLERSGLGGILDYAAEADLAEAAAPKTPAQRDAGLSPADATDFEHRDRTGILSARTYDYAGEVECDANALICARGIEAAGARGDGHGFAAIKLTALGKPELLEHLSKIITETKRMFVAFAEEETSSSGNSSSNATAPEDSHSSASKAPNPHPSIPVSRTLSFPSFLRGLAAINVSLEEPKARKLFDLMDRDRSGGVDFIEWVSFLDPQLLGGMAPRFKSKGLPTLGQGEMDKVGAMIARLERLAELAATKRVKLMVDAEQTYFQPAIDHLVLHLQRKYNRPDAATGRTDPVIFNTYQCYLRDSRARVLLDLERSRREGFVFAAKIVRGAYMVQERRRAAEQGYQDPIWENIQRTHDNYHAVVSSVLSHSEPTQVMIASHNESTVRHVASLMTSAGRPRSGGGVYFGQLLGMCDHVSYSLGACGYQCYKYVPYGPIHDVLPYLIRRAEENSDMLGGAAKERKLLWQEIKRRYRVKLGLEKQKAQKQLQ